MATEYALTTERGGSAFHSGAISANELREELLLHLLRQANMQRRQASMAKTISMKNTLINRAEALYEHALWLSTINIAA